MCPDASILVFSQRRARDEPVPVGDRDSLRATVSAELREHVLNVACHRLRTDNEISRDLLSVPAFNKQLQHLSLTLGEGGLARAAGPRGAASAGAGGQS